LRVTTDTVATREVVLTIEPDSQDVQKALHNAARQMSRRRPLRGYRPGKAPYRLAERVFGREAILDQALNDMAPGLYRQAIEEASIEPYAQGRLDIESTDPVVLKVNVPLVPRVVLGDYKSLRVDPEPEVSVTQEQIDQQIERVRRRQAEYQTVERPVELGDQVVASVIGVSDGETVIDSQDATLDVQDTLAPPGFAEALLGMSKDETREFSLTYPEDFDNESLAGQNVKFSVAIETVREVHLPEINDDLAKEAGDYETLAEMRDGLAVQLKEQLEHQARAREADAALEALVAQATVEYPAVAVEREVDVAVSNQKLRVQQIGFDFEKYLQMIGRSEEQLRDELQPEAERSLVHRLALTEFVRAEGLTLEESEVAGAVAASTSDLGGRADEAAERLRRQRSLGVIDRLLTSKAISHLTAMLTGRAAEDEKAVEEKVGGEAEGAEDETVETEEAQADGASVDEDSQM